MRKLSEEELKWIHTRLKSLHIRYTEVYEEIFDHYCTTLENTPELESPRAIAKLNQSFAWSVVKNMDKELEKNVSKQMNLVQIAYLKFWNFGSKGFLVVLGVVIGVVLFFAVVPETELLISLLIIVSVGLIIAKYILQKNLPFTLKHKPIGSWPASVAKRISLFGNVYVWIYIMPKIFLEDKTLASPLFSNAVLILTLFGILYAASLVAVAFNSPKSKLI
ncbi:hypothetical protein ACPUEN_10865 [Algoriphagus yeomjeoni]|uniref:hypothetical protein n=1 Tax=Algoriphagus yeomjeoni TaxID=291403 RepID=UPI003CE5B5A0